jgi:hypothetical protein
VWPKIVAIALLVVGVGLGVVGNWLKPPANMGGRAIVALFTALLLAAAGITYFSTETGEDDSTQERASAGDGDDVGAVTTSAPTSGTAPSSTSVLPAPAGERENPVTDEPAVPATNHPATTRTRNPSEPAPPCIVGSWELTTIVDYISYADETVTLSYDSGRETRTYAADNTFTISSDELTTHSSGTAEGRYQLNGSTATYDPVSSVGNWTLAVNGEVNRQSSVIFSRGEESVACTANSLRVTSGSDYKASYSRR